MDTQKVWGAQYPFERNHLQRAMTLIAMVSLFAVVVIILVHDGTAGVLGISLLCAGVLCALAGASRLRYVRETRLGFEILRTRGGGFVFGSALVFCVVGAFVAVLVVIE